MSSITFFFLIASSIFSNHTMIMAASDNLEQTFVLSSHSKKRPSSVVSCMQPIDELVQKTVKAAEKQEADAVKKVFYDFQSLTLDSEWEEAKSKYPATQWHFQSLKNSIGSQLFFDLAINQAHQNLLRNALQPLLGFVSEPSLFEKSFVQAKRNVQRIVEGHPYFRKRFTFYALASAAYLGHPLARLLLIEGLKYLYRQDSNLAETSHKESHFFSQNDQLIKLSLQNSSTQLQQFIEIDGIEAFIDLNEEDLNDRYQLEQKALLGLPHYDVLVAQKMITPSRPVYYCDDITIKQTIEHFIKAGDQGDFEGYYNAAILIKQALDHNKVYLTEAERKNAYNLHDRYAALSCMYGFDKAFERLPEKMKLVLKERMAIFSKDIFKDVKKFLTGKK